MKPIEEVKTELYNLIVSPQPNELKIRNVFYIIDDLYNTANWGDSGE
jgi:hypothetical protein